MKPTICIILSLLLCAHVQADNLGLKTVVIDAGHGGKDPGAVSKDKKTYEKSITFDIATMLSDKIKAEYPDVKVVLTRPTDRTLALSDRTKIANDADGDLFISIHINASAKTSPHGYSVHVLGQSSNKNKDLFAYNMDVVKRENAVITMEDDYSTKYSGYDPSDPESHIFMMLLQNSHLEQSMKFAQIISNNLKSGPIKTDRGIWQDPFLVLWQTAMPSVLVELGFISNSEDLAVLKQKSGKDKLAEALFKAFKEYKKTYDDSVSLSNRTVETSPADAVVVASASEVLFYGVQVLVSSKLYNEGDPIFSGHKHKMIKSGNLYKYYLGVSVDLNETKKFYPEIKKKFKDAFIVKIEGETVKRL